MNDPDRPARQPPPANTPFFTGGDRPERPTAPHLLTSSSDSSSYKQGFDPSTPDLPPNLYHGQPGGPQVSFNVPSGSNPIRGGIQRIPSSDDYDASAYLPTVSGGGVATAAGGGGGGNSTNFKRKKSLVRPDRERVDPSHRLWNYRNHAAAMEADGTGRVGFSSTGMYPLAGIPSSSSMPNQIQSGAVPLSRAGPGAPPPSTTNVADASNLRRGKSILAREEGMATESGLNFLKRGATLRRKSTNTGAGAAAESQPHKVKPKKGPLGPWMIYCYVLTFWAPGFLLKTCGLKTKERQSAWREKMGLLGIITLLMAAVGFLTFGFTQTVCGTPPLRYPAGQIDTGSMVFGGYDYDLDKFSHPAAPGIAAGTNPLYSSFDTAAMDGTFLFQNVNGACKGLFTAGTNSTIPRQGDSLGWYFPCNIFNQYGTSPVNKTGYGVGQLCHTQDDARKQFRALDVGSYSGTVFTGRRGPVYYTWDNIVNSSRNLGVYDGNVLDFGLYNWLDRQQVNYPTLFDDLAKGNDSYRARDITMQMVRSSNKQLAQCMVETIRVGFVDSQTIGCVAADVVLYVSLVFIIGVVAIKFMMAVFFGWFLSWRLGAFRGESYDERMRRAAEIEHWTDDIYRPAPARYRPNVKAGKKGILPTTSRFSSANMLKTPPLGGIRPSSTYGDHRKSIATSMYGSKSLLGAGMRNSPPPSPGGMRGSRSSMSLPPSVQNHGKEGSLAHSRRSSMDMDGIMGACPFPLDHVVPQPPPGYEPFKFPLVHTICLVTAYSESVEGLRTTLDSLATTDYPNSHKLLLVIADGMVKGSGNKMTTPEICISMMKELLIPAEDVEPQSYVAIADGHKRHNMAKIYSGFYDYDDNTVETSKQQRVPMIVVAKVGNPLETHEAKPGNRGKRDSQVLLMSFLQKVMFDERMTAFDYEFFNSIWRCTGISPDHYELCLMVDADTKVFPDSLTRMAACMVYDPEIMGLCGETKIANKSETWVTMIQVFEYYISHHLTKAFESMFGGVTCLPGCFSMYRVKSPKGADGYWVPILANPDIVEHYSENVVDNLHKKNLLLLGEDRYLTTLMLKTFPKRKMMFCPQAVCKTVVPDTFRVLLSQRRRWINSTIHNLFELLLVRDLCGTFCFSMQFVVFMELVGTLVLPAAIAFTGYLIVITIIPGTTKPIIPLILLGIILGLPGLLIVVTSRRIQYVGWMLIYLVSLPIWNFVLPAYSYFHMDDFSWGETRKVSGGGAKETNHGDKEGEFNSQHIIMKRWSEFERERRWKTGTHSRESTYDVIHRTGSPKVSESNRDRFSMISSSETGLSSNDPFGRSASGSNLVGGAVSYAEADGQFPRMASVVSGRGRLDTVPLLELPAPLASSTRQSSPASAERYPSAHSSAPQSIEGARPGDAVETLDGQPVSPPVPEAAQQYSNYNAYDAEDPERQAILTAQSPPLSPMPDRNSPTQPAPAGQQTQVAPDYSQQFTSEPADDFFYPVADLPTRPFDPNRMSVASRGVSLVDDGPVPAASGVLMAVQQRQRRASQGPLNPNRMSRTSSVMNSPTSESFGSGPSAPPLPPGAAPSRFG